MTDEYIIKALECCVFKTKCEECPYEERCWDLSKDAAILIKLKKAEIERLTERIEQQNEQIADLIADLETALADAVSVFAEMVKAHTRHLPSAFNFGKIVDELVEREMTEGEQ